MTDSSGNPLVEGNHPSQSILSEKVNRALQVRTDAPAMKAALDALAHLNDNDNDDNNNNDTKNNNTNESKQKELFSFDSRSVRVAIEHDALQQALKLKNELRSLVNTVQDLRQGVSETAEIARRVRAATQMQVITTETLNHMIPGSASSHHAEENAVITEQQTMSATTTTTTTTTAAATGGGLQQEVALASQLSDAFLHRDMARKRLQAVHAFLEKFDLSQEDSRLLDHYNFEDAEQNAENIANGLAFLKALDRVRHIRNALTDTFGDGGGGGGTSGDLAFLQKHEDYSMDHHQRKSLGASSALRMMEGLAQKQERAYERLYHWLQKYLHLFSTAGASNTNTNTNTATTDADAMDEALQHSFVKRAVYTLRHVPAFYSHTLELIASSRRAEETRRFLLALTSGYAGMQPIEMKAHDPVACEFTQVFCKCFH